MNESLPLASGSGAPPAPAAAPASAAAVPAATAHAMAHAAAGPAAHLASLVARARGTLPLLQRRQPALFEPSVPWAGGVAATVGAPPVPAAAASPGRSESSQGGPVASPSERRALAEPAGEPVRRGSDAPAMSALPALPRSSARGPQEPAGERAGPPTPAVRSDLPAASKGRGAAFDDARPAPPPRTPEHAPPAQRSTPLLRPSAGEPVRPGRPTALPASVPPAAPPALARPAAMPAPPTTGMARRSPSPPDLAGVLGPVRRRAEPPPAPSRVLHAAPRVAASPAAVAPPPALPSVQVSIGRIEVRATTSAPPPATRQASATGPQLTLDAYLSGRNGAAR